MTSGKKICRRRIKKEATKTSNGGETPSIIDLNEVVEVLDENWNESEDGQYESEPFAAKKRKLEDMGEEEEVGLVYSKDDIPDDVFERMIRGSVRKVKEEIDNGDKERDGRGLVALVLAPTRELALQVKDHISTAAKYTDIMVC